MSAASQTGGVTAEPGEPCRPRVLRRSARRGCVQPRCEAGERRHRQVAQHGEQHQHHDRAVQHRHGGTQRRHPCSPAADRRRTPRPRRAGRARSARGCSARHPGEVAVRELVHGTHRAAAGQCTPNSAIDGHVGSSRGVRVTYADRHHRRPLHRRRRAAAKRHATAMRRSESSTVRCQRLLDLARSRRWNRHPPQEPLTTTTTNRT